MHPSRRVLALGFAGSLLGSLVLAGPTVAASAFTFNVNYSSTCITVSGPASTNGTLRHLTSGGTLLDMLPVSLNGAGNATVCLDDLPLPGQQVSATFGPETRTITLPKVSLRVDRATDVLRGTAPAGKTVKLTVIHYTGLSGASTTVTRTKTASSTGTWSTDMTSAVNIAGGDVVLAAHTTAAGDVIGATEVTPALRIWIGRPAFTAALQTGTGGKVTLRTPSGTTRATGVVWAPAAQLTEADGTFLKSESAVSPRVGDRVSAPFQSNMSFTIPNLTVSVSTAADTVTGACPAGRWIRVRVIYPGDEVSTVFKCPSGATYTASFAGSHDIVAGDRVEVTARVAHGDFVLRRKTAS